MLEIIALYDRPWDYPEQYVARWFKIDRPTNRFIIADTLEDLMERLKPDIANKTFIIRSDEDHETVIGTYL